MATAAHEEHTDLSEACEAIQEYPRKRDDESDQIVMGLATLLDKFNKDPKAFPDIILNVINLTEAFSFPKTSSKIGRSLLVVFRHVWKTYSEFYSIPDHSSLSSDIKAKAFGFLCKLKDSLHCLMFLSGNNPDRKCISTVCSEISLGDTGSEYFGDLSFKIQQLQKRELKEKTEYTVSRYKAIVDHIDLYCSLSSLREFTLLYLVTFCLATGSVQGLAEGYFEVTKRHRTERESTSNILYEPEPEFAGVAAVFNNGNWPMLKMHTQNSHRFQLQHCGRLDKKKVQMVSCEDDRFGMFRHPSEKTPLLTQKKYMRVFTDKRSEFLLEKTTAFDTTYFVIRLEDERNLTLKIDSNGYLVTNECQPDEYGLFNILLLSNGSVMLSCRKHPTLFVTMVSAKSDARLEAKNFAAGSTSCWQIVEM